MRTQGVKALVYLHSRDGPGLPSKHNDPLCDTLRTAVQVVLGACQVVAEAPQKGTREYHRHLISPADTAAVENRARAAILGCKHTSTPTLVLGMILALALTLTFTLK